MKYEMDFPSGHLRCWNCGEDILDDGGVLIEWQVGFTKEVNCKICFAMLLANDKDIKVLATLMPIKDVKSLEGNSSRTDWGSEVND